MLLFDVVYAHRASGSHHRIALDALRRLAMPDAEAWRKLFIANADVYMKGAKAPDDVFRDSQNHVLHVRDNYWGGAVETAEAWYEKLLTMLRAQNWPEAVYAAGVLSHYVCDPMQPLHTAQSEAEGAIHRAFEQSVSKSYANLIARLDAGGWPDVPPPSGPGWLRALIRRGAESGVIHYEACIDHYDLAAGVKDPPAGLDATLLDAMAGQLGLAIASFARVIERAVAEAKVAAPVTHVTLQGYLATLDIPIQWVLRKMEDAAERAVVAEMYAEFGATGKVVKTLAHDDRIVRAAHAREVLQRPLSALDAEPARAPGSLHGFRVLSTGPAAPVAGTAAPAPAAPAAQRPAPAVAGKRRTRESPVVDAPAIGEKIAARLTAIGVKTIGDLLGADAHAVAAMLQQRAMSAQTVTDWQAMARLAVDVQAVGEQDAQILIACGVRDASALAGQDAAALQSHLAAFLASEDGKRLTRGHPGPKPAKVEAWIAAAKAAA
ncbi:MAG: DUF4332 domain-containing protein [Hyphomonadaceae bacterium]|nr:DUF4332 domain-containing protein [Hyphomonadaceae bacterium]